MADGGGNLSMMTYRADGPLTEGQTYAVAALFSALLGTDARAEITFQHVGLNGHEAIVIIVMRHDHQEGNDHLGLPVALLLDAEVMDALGDLLQPPDGVRVEELDDRTAPRVRGVEVYGVPNEGLD